MVVGVGDHPGPSRFFVAGPPQNDMLWLGGGGRGDRPVAPTSQPLSALLGGGEVGSVFEDGVLGGCAEVPGVVVAGDAVDVDVPVGVNAGVARRRLEFRRGLGRAGCAGGLGGRRRGAIVSPVILCGVKNFLGKGWDPAWAGAMEGDGAGGRGEEDHPSPPDSSSRGLLRMTYRIWAFSE